MGESELETSENEAILFANNKEEFFDMSDKSTAAIVRAHIQNLQFTYGEYSEVMARLVQKHYAKLGRVNRGIRKQPLRVLYATDMPSILTEVGFMSNSTELKYITSESGQKELVGALYAAVKEYVTYVKKSLLIESTSEQTTSAPQTKSEPSVKQSAKQPVKQQTTTQQKSSSTPKSTTVATKSSSVRYTVQIMASKSAVALTDSRFGSYKGKVRQVRAEGAYSYKYCVGDYADRASAQATVANIRKSFPQAFVIAVKDGKVVK
jgi:N-acetylmuramoyl-L-alanine amidase